MTTIGGGTSPFFRSLWLPETCVMLFVVPIVLPSCCRPHHDCFVVLKKSLLTATTENLIKTVMYLRCTDFAKGSSSSD